MSEKFTDLLAKIIVNYHMTDNEKENLWENKVQLVRHIYLTVLKHLRAVAFTLDSGKQKYKERLKKEEVLFDQIDAAWTEKETYYIDTAMSPWPINDERHIQNFKLFLSPGYQAPRQAPMKETQTQGNDQQQLAVLEILSQLSALYLYYTLAAPRYTAKIKYKRPIQLLACH